MKYPLNDHFEMIIQSRKDVKLAIIHTQQLVKKHGFSKYDEQQILVSVSELMNNILMHSGAEGRYTCYFKNNELHMIVTDKGKGIENIATILNGSSELPYKGLGLGLRGTKNIMDDFFIETAMDEGVTVKIMKRKCRNYSSDSNDNEKRNKNE